MLDFLPDFVRALVFVLVALIGARFFWSILKLPKEGVREWFSAWIILTCLSFLSGSFALFALGTLLLAWWLRRRQPDVVGPTYIAILPAAPLFGFTIPGVFGINQILVINYQELLTLFLLAPALMASRQNGGQKLPLLRNGVDVAFISYCGWLFLLSFIHKSTLTDSLRSAFEVTVFLALPYIALTRIIRDWKHLHAAIVALVFGGLLVAFVGIMEQRMTWWFHQYVPRLLGMDALPAFTFAQEERFGLVRIKATAGNSIGYVLVLAFSGMIYLWKAKAIQGWRVAIGSLIFLVAILFTGSRGAWLASALAVGTMYAFPLIKSPARFIASACAALVAIPVIRDFFLSTTDRFGTFDYRAELIRSATPMVWEKPVLGWAGFQELLGTGRLEHLRQGQGIIDLVNTYLGEALFSGIPGVLLFCAMLFWSLWTVLRRAQRASNEERQDGVVACAAMLSGAVVATAFYLATISMVGHIPSYLWLLAALCSSFAALPIKTTPEPAPAGKRA